MFEETANLVCQKIDEMAEETKLEMYKLKSGLGG